MKTIKKFLELKKKDYLKLFTIEELWTLASKLTECKLKKCVVVGLPYYNWNDVKLYVTYDEVLTLHREPDNQYDKYAIVAYYREYKIGYVRKEDNKHVEPGNYKIKQFKEKSLTIERIDN